MSSTQGTSAAMRYPCLYRPDVAPASRSCVPSCLAMRAQRPHNCLGLFRMKLPAACCGELAKENYGEYNDR